MDNETWNLAAIVIMLGSGCMEPTSVTKIENLCAERDRCTKNMAFVSAGGFLMGWEPNGDSSTLGENYSPLHEVYLDEYCMDVYETTNAEYAECVDARGCAVPRTEYPHEFKTYYGLAGYERYPVVGVTWEQAVQYCEWRGKRLPTEAEWEKAARGPFPDQRLYPWGKEPENERDIPANGSPLHDEVGSFSAGISPYCIFDMSGSAPEFVSDWFSENYYAISPMENPVGPKTGSSHVVRGGTNCAPEFLVHKIPEAYMLVNRYDCFPSGESGLASDVNMIGIRCASRSNGP